MILFGVVDKNHMPRYRWALLPPYSTLQLDPCSVDNGPRFFFSFFKNYKIYTHSKFVDSKTPLSS